MSRAMGYPDFGEEPRSLDQAASMSIALTSTALRLGGSPCQRPTPNSERGTPNAKPCMT
jgi:hypothetical protein